MLIIARMCRKVVTNVTCWSPMFFEAMTLLPSPRQTYQKFHFLTPLSAIHMNITRCSAGKWTLGKSGKRMNFYERWIISNLGKVSCVQPHPGCHPYIGRELTCVAWADPSPWVGYFSEVTTVLSPLSLCSLKNQKYRYTALPLPSRFSLNQLKVKLRTNRHVEIYLFMFIEADQFNTSIYHLMVLFRWGDDLYPCFLSL
jgi:hypothetical protein